MSQKKDITGQQFGRLTAIESTGRKKGTSYIWKFKCSCGKICEYPIKDVTYGSTVSCGCFRIEEIERSRIEFPVKERFELKFGTNVSRLRAKNLQKNNKSGCAGVHMQRRKGRSDTWIATIGFQGQHYYLGSSLNLEDAIEMRKTAEKHIHDGFLDWYKEFKDAQGDAEFHQKTDIKRLICRRCGVVFQSKKYDKFCPECAEIVRAEEEGRKARTVKINAYMSQEAKARLHEIAKEKKKYDTDLISDILEEYIKEKNAKMHKEAEKDKARYAERISKKTKISARIRPEIKKQIHDIAEEEGKYEGVLVNKIMEMYIKRADENT